MVRSRWCNHPALFGLTVKGLDYSEETFCFVTFRNYFSKDDSSLTLFRSVNRPEDADLRENVDWQDHYLGSRGLRHHRKCQSQDSGNTNFDYDFISTIFRTKRVSHQISNVLSSLVSNWKMAEPFRTITSRRSQPFIWFSAFVVVSSNHLSVCWLKSTTATK